uniref:Uncharacterized protein n=1 Tax=Picea sitchensis TaxID=3332 RepID=A0A6B9XTS3_PICSI|nr:hypothetical protein Q903MT_gene3783 [Picea sitchensis]
MASIWVDVSCCRRERLFWRWGSINQIQSMPSRQNVCWLPSFSFVHPSKKTVLLCSPSHKLLPLSLRRLPLDQ